MRTASRSAGTAIGFVLLVVTTVSVCLAAAFSLTQAVGRHVQRSNQFRSATVLGDGAIEFAFATWREKSRPNPNLHLTSADLADLPLPGASEFPGVAGFRITRADDPTYLISNFNIRALGATWQPLADDQRPAAVSGMNLTAATFSYLASADVSLPAISGTPMRVKLRRILQKEIQSPWNYAIFFVDPLEIHPGPVFNVTGWVHTNAKLYTAADTLRFQSKVSYGEDWYIGFMPGDGAHSGQTPKMPGYVSGLPPALEQAQQPFGLDATRIFSTTDANPNNDSYREVIQRPVAGQPDPLAEARYYNQADIRILISDAAPGQQAVTILNQNDQACTVLSTGTNKAIYEVVTTALKLNEQLRDNRETADVKVSTIDVSVLNTELRSGGKLHNKGLKGIVYISDTSASSTSRRGIRLKKGGSLPPGGLTIVSENPVYIQGDYNTGSNGTTQPDSNLSNGDPTRNTVAGYNKQPSAVVADAVMILSNNWDDAKSWLSLSQRTATPTTVNTAIVSGIVPTEGGNYSGGAENFPRFLETWGSNVSFTYYGSMVQLFKSGQATGRWGKSNVYSAPRRHWFFDTQLYTEPPPGTLTLVSYRKGRWYFD